MASAQQELVDFIEGRYHVPVNVELGSKHNRLKWTYNERDFTYVITRSAWIHPRTQNNQFSDIRRMCGQPPEPVRKPHKTMDELMNEIRDRSIEEITPDTDVLVATPRIDLSHEETYIAPPEPTNPDPEPDLELQPVPKAALDLIPEPSPTRTWPVRVSCYKTSNPTPTKNIVSMIFPGEITSVMTTCCVQKLDDEHWRLLPGGPHVVHLSPNGKNAHVRSADDCAPFAMMPVEAVDVDGEVLIYVPLAARQPPQLPPPPKPSIAALGEEFFSDENGGQVDWAEGQRRIKVARQAQLRQAREAKDIQEETQEDQEETMPPATTIRLKPNLETVEKPIPKNAVTPDTIIATFNLEDEMREVLRKIRAIQDTTPYVLATRTRADGSTRWVWQAPDIE